MEVASQLRGLCRRQGKKMLVLWIGTAAVKKDVEEHIRTCFRDGLDKNG